MFAIGIRYRVAAMPPKSFYDLAFGVSPGGARKDAHYVRGSLDEIKADLAYELSESINVYLLCWYGAELALHVYERGERVHSIDIHPFITVSVDGYPDITFLGSGKPTGYNTDTDDRDNVEMTLSDGMFSGELDDAIMVTVDWDGIDVPSLVGEIAVENDHVKLIENHLDGLHDVDDFDEDDFDEDELIDQGYIPYGFTDFEA
jgi:hypothetical protein